MRCAMAREEGNGDVVVREDVDGCGCEAPRGLGIDGRNGSVAWQGLETGTANYGDENSTYGWEDGLELRLSCLGA